jgi:pyridoxine 5-phosphate synthase
MKRMTKLGVNIDHVATVRQARMGREPDPVWAASIAELAGADGITVHLREDRRHIQDRDVRLLRGTVKSKLNLEMAVADEIVDIAIELRPEQVSLVPEKREEVTTEGGLDVLGSGERLARAVTRLKDAGIQVNLFIDPEPEQIRSSADVGADGVELHTGQYALAGVADCSQRLAELASGAQMASGLGLIVAAGHGLDYLNVGPVAELAQVEELNIGHSIISRAVFVGLDRAVREMRAAIAEADGRSL